MSTTNMFRYPFLTSQGRQGLQETSLLLASCTKILSLDEASSSKNWFRRVGDYTTTLTVPATPGEELLKIVRKVMETNNPQGCRTLVIQDGGKSVKSDVVRSNPFCRDSCGREDCLLDLTSGGKGCGDQCWSEGAAYSATCTRCRSYQVEVELKELKDVVDQAYIGETGRSIFTRSGQHLSDYRSHVNGRKPVESWMWQHTVSHHNGVVGEMGGAKDYSWNLHGTFTKPLERQVDEMVRLLIAESCGLGALGGRGWGGKTVTLNSRGEYYRPRIMTYNFNN